jgi:hypothetical protein
MSVRRHIAAWLALSAFAVGSASATTIKAVTERPYTQDQMKTLGEYFGYPEHCGHRTYLRTDESYRGGLYLIADLDTPVSAFPQDTKVVLDIIRTSDGKLVTQTLELSKAFGNKGKALYIGLTDKDNRDDKLLAWRITLTDKDGKTIAESHSFLWNLPQEPAKK